MIILIAFIVWFRQDIDHLISLAQSAGGKLLYDFNIQQRFGARWDATNALTLMRYLLETRQADSVFFELGNEPNYPELTIDGKRMADDFAILRRVMNTLPGFANTKLVGADFNHMGLLDAGLFSKTRLVGPDIGMADVPFLLKIVQDFAKYAAKTVDAITLHHYYFRGPGAKVDQFLDLRNFNAYAESLQRWRDVIWKAAGFELPIWIGETSDAYSYGAPNITNRYVSGFLWLDKLGISAKIGAKLVARQDLYGGNYPLLSPELQPNPDYWLSHVFKQLVGQLVFDTTVSSTDTTGFVRAYTHGTCTGGHLTKLTFFALNLSPNETASIRFNEEYNSSMQLYILSPGPGGLLSHSVLLNGMPLKLVDDYTLPKLQPKTVKTSAGMALPNSTSMCKNHR